MKVPNPEEMKKCTNCSLFAWGTVKKCHCGSTKWVPLTKEETDKVLDNWEI